jgi:hypothetical protein
MDAHDLTITLDVRVEDGHLAGRAAAGTGREREFSGLLGLLTAIERLVAESSGETND